MKKIFIPIVAIMALCVPTFAQAQIPTNSTINVSTTFNGIVTPVNVVIDCKNLANNNVSHVPVTFNGSGATTVNFPLTSASSCAVKVSANNRKIDMTLGGFKTSGYYNVSFAGVNSLVDGRLYSYTDGYVPVVSSTSLKIEITDPTLTVKSDSFKGNVAVVCASVPTSMSVVGSGFNGFVALPDVKVLGGNDLVGLTFGASCVVSSSTAFVYNNNVVNSVTVTVPAEVKIDTVPVPVVTTVAPVVSPIAPPIVVEKIVEKPVVVERVVLRECTTRKVRVKGKLVTRRNCVSVPQ